MRQETQEEAHRQTVDTALKVTRQQGITIAAIRTAIHEVQRIMDNILKR